MQAMMRSCRRFWMGAVVAMILCGTGTAAEAPMRVELWTGGDDGLTQKFAVAIENALISSPDFAWDSDEETVGTLIIRIPTHVYPRHRGGRTRIVYRVEFSTKDDLLIFEIQGCCWASSVKKCAKEVLQDAKRAAGGARFREENPELKRHATKLDRDGLSGRPARRD